MWPLLIDINVPSSFSQEFQRAEWIDEGPAIGATFRGYNQHKLVGEWNVVCTVTALDPEQAFEWTVGDVESKTAKWRFDLAPNESGDGCTLRFSSEMGPGPSGLSAAIDANPDNEQAIIGGRLSHINANMVAVVDAVKRTAENA